MRAFNKYDLELETYVNLVSKVFRNMTKLFADDAHNISVVYSRQPMMNKTYTVTPDNGERSFDANWSITAYTKGGPVNLLKAVLEYKKEPYSHHATMSITTQDLLMYLAYNGVKNVGIFDLSCAEFDRVLTRANKQHINTIGYGGKRSRKSRKSRKSCKKNNALISPFVR